MEVFATEQSRINDFKKYMSSYFESEYMGVGVSAGEYWMDKVAEKLKGMGYFRSPASMKHHGQQEGDLYLHSKVVAMILEELTEKLDLKWQRKDSPKIIGLFHDLCKADEYVKKPNEAEVFLNGSSTTVKEAGKHHFERNPDMILSGHGDKSVILVQRLFDLTEEEMMCIRYHMGAYEGKEVWDNLQRAAVRYPNILWTMQADLMAAWLLNT